MQKIFWQWFHLRTLFAVVVLMGVSLSAAAPERPFRWVDDEDFRPMIYRDASGHPAGIFNNLLRELFRRLDVPLVCHLYPWSRVQKQILEGQADGMVTVLTEERKKFVRATDPVVVMEERVFASRRNPRFHQILKIKSLADLQKFTVVETTGSGWSKEHFKGLKVIWVPTAASALNMVAAGRADVYLMSNYTGPEFVRKQIEKGGSLADRLKEIVMGPFPLARIGYRLLIRKGSPYEKLVDRINRILRRMKKDGTYQIIIGRYLRQNGGRMSGKSISKKPILPDPLFAQSR